MKACKIISPLIDTRGVTIHLVHKMRQNTDTWFSRKRQYFNTIFKTFSMTKYVFYLQKVNNAVVLRNILTNLGL